MTTQLPEKARHFALLYSASSPLCELYLRQQTLALNIELSLLEESASLLGGSAGLLEGSAEITKDKVQASAYLLEPDALACLRQLGLSEASLLNEAEGVYHLGDFVYKYAASDDSDGSNRGTHPDGSDNANNAAVHLDAPQGRFCSRAAVGLSNTGVAFHQVLSMLNDAEDVNYHLDPSLVSYSLNGLCAQQQRFAHPSNDERQVSSSIRYGMVVDAVKLTKVLAELCAQHNITPRKVSAVSLSRIDQITPLHTEAMLGMITQLILTSDKQEKSNALKETRDVDFVFDFRNDQSAFFSEASVAELDHGFTYIAKTEIQNPGKNPLTQTLFESQHGWIKVRTTQHHHYFTAQMMNANEGVLQVAAQQLSAAINIATHSLNWQQIRPTAQQEKPKTKQAEIPQNSATWQHNLLSINLQGQHYISTTTQRSLVLDIMDLWLQYFPQPSTIAGTAGAADTANQHLAKIFNRHSAMLLSNIACFDALFWTGRHLFWTGQHNEQQELAARLALFKACGTHYLAEQDLMSEACWVNTFLALNIWPTAYDVVARSIHEPAQFVHKLTHHLAAAVTHIPPQLSYINDLTKPR